ncbi:MAG: STAS/SEC14 domain-containing protein [Aquidulcibacter sp.]
MDRVAFVTDSDIASIVAKVIDFALPPAARRFHWDERPAALAWLRGDATG